MQEQAWDELLRRIPNNLHDGLVLATVAGAEIIMQSVVQIDANFLIMRGRTAGTSDAGRLIMLPLDKINYVGVPAKLTDQQIKAMFKGDAPQFAKADDLDDDEYMDEHEHDNEDYDDDSSGEHSGDEYDEETEEEVVESHQASKSALLAKLRARLAGDSVK